MTGYLDQKSDYFNKTHREIFAEERDRIIAILNDPVQMRDRRNEGHEWSLAAYNDILDGHTGDHMMQIYMREIVRKSVETTLAATGAHVIQTRDYN